MNNRSPHNQVITILLILGIVAGYGIYLASTFYSALNLALSYKQSTGALPNIGVIVDLGKFEIFIFSIVEFCVTIWYFLRGVINSKILFMILMGIFLLNFIVYLSVDVLYTSVIDSYWSIN